MRTRLHDFPLLENENAVRIDHARKTVRDNQRCSPFHEPAQSLLYKDLVLGINAGQRLVKHENGGILEKGASDGDTLPLTAGESRSTLTNDSFITVGQRHDETMRISGAGRGFDFLLGCLWSGKTQVLRHSAIKKICVLSDHSDMPAQETEGQIAQVPIAKKDTTLLRIQKTEYQRHERRFTRSTRPHNPEFFALAKSEGNIMKHRTQPVLIAEGNVLETYFRLKQSRIDACGFMGVSASNLNPRIHETKNAFGRSHRQKALVVEDDQLPHRPEDFRPQKQKNHKGAQVEIPIGYLECPPRQGRSASRHDAKGADSMGHKVDGEHPHGRAVNSMRS